MTLYKINPGIDTSFSTKLNATFAESLQQCGLNTLRSLIDRAGVWSAGQIDGWGDAYIDSDGREDSVSADETNAEFDTNKYKVRAIPTTYVIIEATSLNVSDFSINNCQCIKLSTGKWMVFCTTGTEEVKRAQIYKTLFYGTDGSNARIKTTYVTGITALKTSVSRDVGKRAYFAVASLSTTSTLNGTYTGTFADTSTNTSFSSWYVLGQTTNQTGCYSRYELPSGSVIDSAGPNVLIDTTGTDRSSIETNNPATLQAECNISGGAGTRTATVQIIALCAGSISWVAAGTLTSSTNIDFYTTHSVPVMTAASETISNIVVHTIPTSTFSSTISKAIGVPLIDNWETDADIQYKLTNGSEDSGWLSCGNTPSISSFTAFTSEPTTLTVKLIPKSSSPTAGYPSIKGFWVRAT